MFLFCLFFIFLPFAMIVTSICCSDYIGGIGVVGGILAALAFSIGSLVIGNIAFGDGAIAFMGLPCVIFGAIGLWMITEGYKKNKH